MSTIPDNLIAELSSFGLSSSESLIYLFLLNQGEQTALSLSRSLKISRATIYNLCQSLHEKNLIISTGKAYSTRFKANSYRQLEALIKQKKSEIQTLEDSLPKFFNELADISLNKFHDSQIIRYEGLDGLKQVTWNSTRAIGSLRVFEVANMSAFLDFDFSERVRLEFIRQKLKSSRQLTNLKEIPAWTNISEFVDIWECRYLDPAEIKTQMEILLYNDVVAMYQYQRQNIFCLEIHDQDLSDTLKQFYDYIWNRSQRMSLLNPRGAVELYSKLK